MTTMRKPDAATIQAVVYDIFGEDADTHDPGNGTTVFWLHEGVRFDQLKELARRLGTSLIDLHFNPGCEDYSEVTPGDPAYLSVVVGWADR